MTQKRSKKINKYLKSKFILVVVLAIGLIAVKMAVPYVSADTVKNNNLKAAKLDVLAQNPNNESIVTEFPDGRSYIEVNINAMNRDGSPLLNEPIVVDKSSSVNMIGPNNTEDGQITLRFFSNRSLTDRIRIKLKNAMTVKKDVRIRFAEDTSLRDLTDKNSFVAGAPVMFEVQIKPWMTDHLQKAQVNFIYTRRINSWGFWVFVKRVVTSDMTCSDGICYGTISQENTVKERNQSGTFTYQFVFKDTKDKTFTKSFKAKLKNP